MNKDLARYQQLVRSFQLHIQKYFEKNNTTSHFVFVLRA